MWVDIANLMGPKGADGADGQRGEPGPINIGLNPDEPLRWDQTGGFTFQFVDGSEQTVNLPIASAQSAGLLGAGGRLPSTGARDITSLSNSEVVAGTIRVIRSGPTVTVSLNSIRFSGENNGFGTIVTLPYGFRPPTSLADNIAAPEDSAQISLSVGGAIGMNRKSGYTIRRIITFVTEDLFPTELPGSPV